MRYDREYKQFFIMFNTTADFGHLDLHQQVDQSVSPWV